MVFSVIGVAKYPIGSRILKKGFPEEHLLYKGTVMGRKKHKYNVLFDNGITKWCKKDEFYET